MRNRFILAILLVLALLAASCGGDDGEGSGAENDDATDAEEDPDPDPDPEPDPDPDPDADPDPEPVERTASARGITEDTIRIGLAIPDLSAFSNGGDIVARYRLAGDAVNADGGVIGRQIEFVVEEWDSLDTTGVDAACIALTEDTEVFAVITRLPGALGDISCFSGLGETITVSGTGAPGSAIASAEGRLFATNADPYAAMIGALADLADDLAGAKVALNGSDDPGEEQRLESLADALTAAGIEVVATTLSTISYNDDPTASLSEQDTFSQVWVSNGATHVMGVGTAVTGAVEAIENNELQDELVVITGALGLRTLGALGTDLSNITMIGVAAEDQFTVGEDGRYGTDVCLQRVEDELGEVIDYDVEPGEVNNLPSSLQGCAAMDFLVAALEAAGPNPTQADFLAVVEAGLDFEMTGSPSSRADTQSIYLNRGAGQIFDWDGTEFIARG